MGSPTPADMQDCRQKCRCPVGPYADEAYSCIAPCAGQAGNCTFNCAQGCVCVPYINYLGVESTFEGITLPYTNRIGFVMADPFFVGEDTYVASAVVQDGGSATDAIWTRFSGGLGTTPSTRTFSTDSYNVGRGTGSATAQVGIFATFVVTHLEGTSPTDPNNWYSSQFNGDLNLVPQQSLNDFGTGTLPLVVNSVVSFETQAELNTWLAG